MHENFGLTSLNLACTMRFYKSKQNLRAVVAFFFFFFFFSFFFFVAVTVWGGTEEMKLKMKFYANEFIYFFI